MLRVQVDSSAVNEKRGTSVKSGKPFLIREQEVYVYLVDSDGVEKRFPAPMKLGLDDSAPYPPGEYFLRPDCLYVGEYGRLMVGRITLIPHDSKVKAA